MKKSKVVSLALITAALASCHKDEAKLAQNGPPEKKVYMRADSSASYSHAHCHSGANPWLWYYAFRPYGYYDSHGGGSYHRAGFYSGGIHENSNIGTSGVKASATGHSSGTSRGGFGKGNFSVSS